MHVRRPRSAQPRRDGASSYAFILVRARIGRLARVQIARIDIGDMPVGGVRSHGSFDL
jgi:hypothetical protein